MLKQGKSTKEVALRFNLTTESIRTIAIQKGLIVVYAHRERQIKRRELIMDCLKEGLAPELIERRFGLSDIALYYYYRQYPKYNYPSRYRRKKKNRDDKIILLLKKKVPQKNIAQRFNLNKITVYKIAREHGLTYYKRQGEAIRQLLKAGWQPSQIAEEKKVDVSNVYRQRKKMRMKNEL